MTDFAACVAEIVALNEGCLRGKTRLQKSAYFLEAHQLGYGFEFEYHYYGPYSEDVAVAVEDARVRSLIDIERRLTSKGDAYSVFKLAQGFAENEIKCREERTKLLHVLSSYSTVTIELAATADFLMSKGENEAWAETKLRKTSKATPERIDSAKQLLQRLALEFPPKRQAPAAPLKTRRL